MKRPRIVVAALRGGSGKTILSVGIIAAWRRLGFTISSFKKGPDYIDAGWLGLAAGRPCHNLDTFLIPEPLVFDSFLYHSAGSDCAVIEGNRGLFDGADLHGTTSTAALAKLLQAPVVLCVDATKSTRTIAAIILGCMRFESDVAVQGVILNRTAGSRHETILRQSIEHYCGIPVLGAVPKLNREIFPERHMGLVPTPEHRLAVDAVTEIAKISEKYLDLTALMRLAQEAPDFHALPKDGTDSRSDRITDRKSTNAAPPPRIGIIRDSAFQFYYPENIDALVSAGARTVMISPLKSGEIPQVDALYIGGGFPETHAKELADNQAFKSALKGLAKDGLPIYAECGGLMYLAQELHLDQRCFLMSGVLPLVLGFSHRPQGHGYTVVSVDRANPYFPKGMELKGHEFHYSKVIEWRGRDDDLIFRMKRGVGVWNRKDGICYKNVLATYTHLHALGVPEWADALVRNAASYRRTKK